MSARNRKAVVKLAATVLAVASLGISASAAAIHERLVVVGQLDLVVALAAGCLIPASFLRVLTGVSLRCTTATTRLGLSHRPDQI